MTASSAARLCSWFACLRDRLRVADPGRVRLRIGLRALIAAAVSAEVLSRLARAFDQPIHGTLSGVFIAIISALLVNDPTPAQQLVTLLLLPLGGIWAATMASLTAPVPYLGPGLFLAFVFLAIYLRKYGPRFGAFGTSTFMIYYFALYLRVDLSQLGWTIVWLLLGSFVAAVVRFLLVREQPEAVMRKLCGDYFTQVALLLHQLARLCRDGRWHREGRLRRDLERLSETALLLSDQLDVEPEAPLRNNLFESELAMERIAWSTAWILERKDRRTSDLAALRLERARCAVRTREGAQVALLAQPEKNLALDPLDESLSDLLSTLPRSSCRWVASQKRSPARGNSAGDNQVAIAWRQAIQATAACGLAMLIGRHISPARWQWAVLAAFVVFARATTVSDSIVRAWQRTLGTILGAAAGFAAAELLRGNKTAELGLVFLCIFGAYYVFRTAYTVMVGLITTMLALLYDLMGMFTPGLLVLRLEETLIGAAMGAAAAILVLPTPARPIIWQKLAATFNACAELLDATIISDSSRDPAQHRRELALRLQHLLQDARTSAKTLLLRGILAPLRKDLPLLFYRVTALVFYAVQISTATGSTRCDYAGTEEELGRLKRLAEKLRRLASQPGGSVERLRRPRSRPGPWPNQPSHCIECMEQLVDDLVLTLPTALS